MIGTCNTYGLRSINTYTFNGSCHNGDLSIKYGNYIWLMPVNVRNYTNTLFRVNNLIFNALGYLPQTKGVSGLARMCVGATIVVVTLVIGTPIAQEGLIVGRWYEEALLTGIAQVFRGGMEALVPYGRIVNACLDIIGTINNVQAERHFDPSKYPDRYINLQPEPSFGGWEVFQPSQLQDPSKYQKHADHHPDPTYWGPFQFLRLV